MKLIIFVIMLHIFFIQTFFNHTICHITTKIHVLFIHTFLNSEIIYNFISQLQISVTLPAEFNDVFVDEFR